ncbi:MAG: DUF4145 domain-containing protein [Anaeromyxobacteraceae bacterium]
MKLSETHRNLLRAVLEGTLGDRRPPVQEFRIENEKDRGAIDELEQSKFLARDDGEYRLTLDGLYGADSDAARGVIRTFNALLPSLKNAYRADPSKTWAASEIDALARESGLFVKEHATARALGILSSEVHVWSGLSPPAAGMGKTRRWLVDSVTFIERVLDQEPLAEAREVELRDPEETSGSLQFAAARSSTKRNRVVEAAPYLPLEVIPKSMGVIRSVLDEANRCFSNECYNGCAALLRRVVELLLVEAYRRNGIADAILDTDGERLLPLGRIIGRLTAGQDLSLSPVARKSLEKVKLLGDLGAHHKYALIRRGDLDRLHDGLRPTLEELVVVEGTRRPG